MNYNKNNDTKSYNDYGIACPWVLKPFDDTFHKSGFSAFQKFLMKNSNIKKWIIASDYVFNDKNKPNNVVVFSIIPNKPFLVNFSQNILSKDFKKTKDFTKTSLDFLNNMEVFTICLIFPNKREKFFQNDSSQKAQDMWSDIFSMLKKMLDIWCQDLNNPNLQYFQDISTKVKRLSNTLSHGNLRLWQKIFAISSFVAYIIVEMSLLIKIDLVGWFSDRDEILSFKSKGEKIKGEKNHPFIHDLVFIYNHVLAEKKGCTSCPTLCFAIPNDDGNNMWYDHINRIPDIVAGCIADYNFPKNTVTSQKACTLMEDVISDNENIQIFNIANITQVWRYDIKKLNF